VARAEIGIFGGSGFYSLLEGAQEITVDTPYGPPSDVITVGEIAGRRVAFLPRHGKQHQFPPHLIHYRAHIAASARRGAACPAGGRRARGRARIRRGRWW